MLDRDQIIAASRTLRDHWRAGTKLAALDPMLRPRDRAEGYAIQGELAQASTESYSAGRSPRPARPARSTSMWRAQWPDVSCARP
jgi:hypothetical protein